jgi:hypothetical protein
LGVELVCDIKEEHRVRLFENRVLRRTGPEGDELMVGWRKQGAAWFVLFAKNNQNYQVEEDEMGGACKVNSEEEDHIQVTGRKIKRKETTKKNKM